MRAGLAGTGGRFRQGAESSLERQSGAAQRWSPWADPVSSSWKKGQRGALRGRGGTRRKEQPETCLENYCVWEGQATGKNVTNSERHI